MYSKCMKPSHTGSLLESVSVCVFTFPAGEYVHSYPWGQLCAPPNTHVQCRYKQDKWTDKHRSVQTGKQTDTHTHAGSQYWATPQTWHPLDPSRGHLKGSKAISPSHSFILCSPPPSFCPTFGPRPNNQSCWWLCFQLSQPLFPPPSLPPAVRVTSRNPEPTSPKGCFGR